MEKVRQAYERIQTLHTVARHELVVAVLEGGHDRRKCHSESEIEMWFKRPKLRIEYKPLTGSVAEAPLVPQVIIADGEYEYRLSEGKWAKIKHTVDALNFFGLFRAVYTSKQEGELFGRPVWVVEGQIGPGLQATWWIDKDLTVGRYELKGTAKPPFEAGLDAEVCNTIQFQKLEPGFNVPDEKF
ncbi:hypothetical protein H5T52_10300, partial [Candidatus Bipolaricaulota bacterium]|nr:hypothetical protein [Candidatus Bipolaricaulota bacterium]